MKSGVNRLQGRNSNYMDFNPDGSTILSSGNTSILINTDSVPTAPVVTPSTPSTIVVPNLSKTTGSFETVVDIIPLTSSINPLDIRPTASLNYEDIFAIEIPDEEEIFTNLQKNRAIIDYIDTAEEETSLIAVNIDDLKKNKY